MKTLFTPDTNWNQQEFRDLTREPIVSVDLRNIDKPIIEFIVKPFNLSHHYVGFD